MKISVDRISDKTTPTADSHMAVASVLNANGDKSRKFETSIFLNVPDKLSAEIKENDVYECVLSTEYVNVNMNMGDSGCLVWGTYHKTIPDKYLPLLKEYAEYSCVEFDDGIILVDEKYKNHYDDEYENGSMVPVNPLFSFNLLEIVS